VIKVDDVAVYEEAAKEGAVEFHFVWREANERAGWLVRRHPVHGAGLGDLRKRALPRICTPTGADPVEPCAEVRVAVGELLLRLGVSNEQDRAEREEMVEIVVGPTASRSVLGSMN